MFSLIYMRKTLKGKKWSGTLNVWKMHTDKWKTHLGSSKLSACPKTPASVPLSRQMHFSKAKQTAEYAAAPLSAGWAVIHSARKVVLSTSQKGTQSTHTDLSVH